jgi:hypothetical protein
MAAVRSAHTLQASQLSLLPEEKNRKWNSCAYKSTAARMETGSERCSEGVWGENVSLDFDFRYSGAKD